MLGSNPVGRSPFAGCRCALGSDPTCPADRHLTPEPPEFRRVREGALERMEAMRINRRLATYVGDRTIWERQGRVIA